MNDRELRTIIREEIRNYLTEILLKSYDIVEEKYNREKGYK